VIIIHQVYLLHVNTTLVTNVNNEGV